MSTAAPLSPLPADERVLLLMGLLTSQDRHGYEINEFIERQLQCVTDLKKATAYQLLERLEQHGLIQSHSEQQGRRPQRKVYALTPGGHAQFLELLATHLRNEEPLILPGNVAVMFCEHLPVAERLAALRERARKLEARLAVYVVLLEKLPLTTGVGLAVGRIQALTRTDLDWTRDRVAELEAGR